MASGRPRIAVLGLILVAAGVGAYLLSRPEPAQIVGVVRATEIRVAPEVAGQLAAIKVQKGESVHAGDVVAELSAIELTSAVEQARAALDAAKASRDNVYVGVRAEQVAMLAAAIAKARGSMALEQELELGDALLALPVAAQRALDLSEGVADMAQRYLGARGFMFIGRGYTLPGALEGALKLKEVSYIHAEGYAAGELKHGPISLLDAECPLVAVATKSRVYDKLISNVMEGRARDAKVIAVATEGDGQINRFADDVVWVPDTHEVLSPVLAVIPLQLFAYYTAVARGNDVDQPRNLAKSVTVE